jgi:hypothetical protein
LVVPSTGLGCGSHVEAHLLKIGDSPLVTP